MAKNRAKDLADISINLQVIPILNENEKFDYLKFYAVRLFLVFFLIDEVTMFFKDMLMLSPEEVEMMPDPREDFKVIFCEKIKDIV